MSLLQQARFFTTVNHLSDLPPENNGEIAFAGRSNAGKSSAINTLARRNRLAFVSKTPGRTQHINYFELGNNYYLVDLPGYGYAKVPDNMRKHWVSLLSNYLQIRQSLCGLVLIMDIRHPLTKLDWQMLEWFAPTGRPIHILLTKADKLTRFQSLSTLQKVQKELDATYINCSVQLFSSTTRIGVEEAQNVIEAWLFHTPEIKNPRLKGSKTGGKQP